MCCCCLFLPEISSMKQPAPLGQGLAESQGANLNLTLAVLSSFAWKTGSPQPGPQHAMTSPAGPEHSTLHISVSHQKARERGQMDGRKGGILQKQFRKCGDLSRSLSQKRELIGCLQGHQLCPRHCTFCVTINLALGRTFGDCYCFPAHQRFLHSIRLYEKWGMGSYIGLNHITLVSLSVKWSNVAILCDSACHFSQYLAQSSVYSRYLSSPLLFKLHVTRIS